MATARKTPKEKYEDQLKKTEKARKEYLNSLPPHSEEYRNARYEDIQKTKGSSGSFIAAVVIFIFMNIIYAGILIPNIKEFNAGTFLLILFLELWAIIFAAGAYNK
ncbi:hypothetical protein IKF94_00840 [Candidatus Saccharibacteria bacterium]|nr:hypothetical protein [Candidatus Saccharibacteria bacterium]